jgi:hypothetical protein
MSRLTVVLALLPAAFFTPLVLSAPGTQSVNVVLQVNKITSEAAIDVWNNNKSEVLAHSCSLSLASGSFEGTPLAFAVNEYGAGNFSVGPQTYAIHDNPDISGGIVCGRIASPGEFIVSCDVPVSASLPLKSLNKRDLQDCFPHGPVELSSLMKGLESTPSTKDITWSEGGPSLDTTEIPPADLDKRQGPCGFWTARTFLVGDGFPHQNPLNIQISVRLALPGPDAA